MFRGEFCCYLCTLFIYLVIYLFVGCLTTLYVTICTASWSQMTGWQWVMNCWELRRKYSLPYIKYADSCLTLWKWGGGIAKFAQILGILNNTFRPPSVQKTWGIKVHIMHRLSPCFYMEEKSGSSEERIKKKDINRGEIFGRVVSKASWRETKKIQVKLTSTCDTNEQQQDTKNNAEL